MPRPRKSIRYTQSETGWKLVQYPHGTEVPGLSVNASTGTFYSIRSDGSRQYWGRDLAAAIQAYRDTVDGDAPHFETDEDGHLGYVVTDEWAEKNAAKSNVARFHIDRRRAAKGLPPLYGPSYPVDVSKASVAEPPQSPAGNRLRDAWTVLDNLKQGEVKATTLTDYKTAWNRFITAIGNKRVSELTADDFATWRRWVARSMANRSGTYINHTHTAIKTIFSEVRRDRPGWGWPAGLTDWLTDRRSVKHRPDRKHRAMMPVDAYETLIETADSWKIIDPSVMPANNQSARRLRQLAELRRRLGYRIGAAIRLAANCGLGLVDLQTIQWQNLKLDAPIPYMDFPREKTVKQVGAATPRLIPLLPGTVKALRELRDQRNPSDYVFPAGHGGTYAEGRAYSERGIKAAIKYLFDAAGVTEWTFKHLRNIGGSLAKRAKLSRDERTAFLGHVEQGTNRFYEDDCDETYLVSLVNLIGRTYFKGEEVSATSGP